MEPLDISYFAIVVLFRFMFSTLLEHLLDDKFSMPFTQTVGKITGEKRFTALSMVNSDAENSPAEGSSRGKNMSESDRKRVREIINKNLTDAQRKANNESIDRIFDIGNKMDNVLKELEDSTIKLRNISKDVKLHEHDGGLQISAPLTMSDSEAQSIARQIGALDRSIQNKFSEYNNLSKKDARLNNSDWTVANKVLWEITQQRYKNVFEKSNK